MQGHTERRVKSLTRILKLIKIRKTFLVFRSNETLFLLSESNYFNWKIICERGNFIQHVHVAFKAAKHI